MKKILVAIVGVILLVSCGSKTSTDTTTFSDSTVESSLPASDTFEYTITVGENTGTDVVIEVVQGSQVILTVVNSQSHDEVHLHGYDLSTGTIEKGETGTMTFDAINTGVFDIESHESGELISVLRVVAS